MCVFKNCFRLFILFENGDYEYSMENDKFVSKYKKTQIRYKCLAVYVRSSIITHVKYNLFCNLEKPI